MIRIIMKRKCACITASRMSYFLLLLLLIHQHAATGFMISHNPTTTTTPTIRSIESKLSNEIHWNWMDYHPVSLTRRQQQRRQILSATIEDGTEIMFDDGKQQESISQLPDMEAYAKGYKTVFQEVPFRKCSPTVGTVPTDLRGTYFRSGPAMFSAGSIVPPKTSIVRPKQPPVLDGADMDRMVLHPFEGDGAVLGITFSPPVVVADDDETPTSSVNENDNDPMEVSVRYRYVRTVGFTAERKKGARTYKGMDPTRSMMLPHVGNDFPLPAYRHHLQPGLNKFRKNTSNTRAVYWCNRLFSMWDGGLPYKLDARACDTEGKSRFGGAILKDDDPLGSKMVYDPVRENVLFYGIVQGMKSSQLTLYEFDAKFKLVPAGRQEYDLPGFAVLNDFTATSNFAIFLQPDITIKNTMEYMISSKDPGKVLHVNKDGASTLYLLPRAGTAASSNKDNKNKQQPPMYKKIKIPGDEGFSDMNVQFCNAYEDGKYVVMDVIRSESNHKSPNQLSAWPWGTTIRDYQSVASKKSLWRFIVDTSSDELVSKRLLYDRHLFFGNINPRYSTRKHQYIYANVGAEEVSSSSPLQGIAKVDTSEMECPADVWMPEAYEFCGEPMYAPRVGDTDDSAEDSGYILSILFNGRTESSEIIIFVANDIAAGPITRIPLNFAIPHGLFGCYAPNCTWGSDEIERRAKLADKIESRGNMWNEVKSDFAGLGLRLDDMEEYFGDFFT